MQAAEWLVDQMGAAVERSDFLIFMVSRRSMKSEAVQTEWKTKLNQSMGNKRRTVIPFIVDDVDFSELPPFLKGIYMYRYSDGPETVTRLVNDIIAKRER